MVYVALLATGCGEPSRTVLAAFALDAASEFSRHFPAAGFAPELQQSEPAFVVVFLGGLPGPVNRVNPGVSSSEQQGTVQGNGICIWIGDPMGGQMYLYSDVDLAGMEP